MKNMTGFYEKLKNAKTHTVDVWPMVMDVTRAKSHMMETFTDSAGVRVMTA